MTFHQETINELAASIREHGVLQPILVRPSGDTYEIIAGERRWRASKVAGKETIPAIVERFDDATALEIALIENLQREDLSPLDEAVIYKKMTGSSATRSGSSPASSARTRATSRTAFVWRTRPRMCARWSRSDTTRSRPRTS